MIGLLWCAHAHAATIDKYIVEIEPNFIDQSIVGETKIKFSDSESKTLNFPLYGIQIDSVKSHDRKVPFKTIENSLSIDLSKLKHHSLTIKYHGKPTKGLVWGKNYVYTDYQPCAWMICSENPGQRLPIVIKLTIPKEMKSVASGVLESARPEKNKRIEKWITQEGHASYLYGFAIGSFESYSEKIGKHEIEFLGIEETVESLKKKFQITNQIIQFFEEKSSVQLPVQKYTQVLVPGDEAQEKSTFSILGKNNIDPILQNPQEDWAIVHELAHQWWGNALTCKSWEHFWLNEGITVFMTAAYKQKTWGEKAYRVEMDLIQKRYQKAIDAKFDQPLTYAGEYPSLSVKRAIVYNKAALFMAALRKEMGEQAFWKGIQSYTRKHLFQSVESKQFQENMEMASGKSLDVVFKKWVY